MYYSGSAEKGNDRVSAAFSNVGIMWTKNPNPVVYPQVNPTSAYGAGQPSAYNYNGGSGIYLFHTDQYGGTDRVFVRASTDGVNFSAPTLVSNAGIDSAPWMADADFGYDPGSRNFYAVVPVTGRAGDRDSYGFGFYRLEQSQVLTGSGTWETLGFADTNLNGYYINSSPGLTRDPSGILSTVPVLIAYMGAGTNDPATWDLTYAWWTPNPAKMQLKGYWSGRDHLSTTGYQPPGYNPEGPQGYLLMAPASDTVKLWNCVWNSPVISSDYYNSLDRGCGDPNQLQRLIGLNGYVYSQPPTGVNTVPLYSCYTNTTNEYFTSTSSNCEGQAFQGSLG